MTHPRPLAIQLYGLRKLGGLDTQLRTAREAGFSVVETVQSHLEDAGATRRALDAHGLAALSGHVSLPALRNDLAATVRAASAVGIRKLYMPALPADERTGGAAGWRRAGRELGEMALRVSDQGLSLGYHNHDWELAVMEDGRPALLHLFDGAQGTPLTWQADLAWLARGGGDPAQWLVEQGGRVSSVHIKDIAPAGERQDEDGWTDVGSGIMDWHGLWRACQALEAPLMVVEHDNPKRPDQFARGSLAFLTALPPAPAV